MIFACAGSRGDAGAHSPVEALAVGKARTAQQPWRQKTAIELVSFFLVLVWASLGVWGFFSSIVLQAQHHGCGRRPAVNGPPTASRYVA